MGDKEALLLRASVAGGEVEAAGLTAAVMEWKAEDAEIAAGLPRLVGSCAIPSAKVPQPTPNHLMQH